VVDGGFLLGAVGLFEKVTVKTAPVLFS